MLRDTIKAKCGYRVVKAQVRNSVVVYDGTEMLYVAELKSVEQYFSEQADNECFKQYEVFTDCLGNQFVYWGDFETGDDFLTQVA